MPTTSVVATTADTWPRGRHAKPFRNSTVFLARKHGSAIATTQPARWIQIEQATRKYAARTPGDVYVFTGPTFYQRPSTIGAGGVWVPSHTWKVVYSRREGRAWAYWMTNTAGSHSLEPID
ncbi:DNA/RNA non-specific endonuclease [Variovorax sp. RHLX14]|uniref:DNA/RNA non-specific endonuclease n=1 Tax=Variovorax sp. RHLX14 TaxID=1259731 RepID=UPI003F4537CC